MACLVVAKKIMHSVYHSLITNQILMTMMVVQKDFQECALGTMHKKQQFNSGIE
jgi:hypothetical protein